MASKTIILSGKSKFSHLHVPDQFGFWSINVFLDEPSKVLWAKLKEEGILNRLREDKNGEGQFVTLRQPVEKKMKGVMTKMDPVSIIKDGIPFIGVIGDGSDISCMITVYDYRKPITKELGRAIRLTAVKVRNLVEGSISTFPEEVQPKVKELLAAEDPIW